MLNLRDNKPLNNKLEEIIYHGDQHGATEWQMTAADLKNKDFIVANRNSVIRAMIYQWFKQRFVKTLSDADIARARQMGWLRRIESADGVEWLQRALEKGQDVYDFVPEKFDDSVWNEITGICDFMYSVCDAYLNQELDKEKINAKLSYLTTINEYDTYDKVRDLSDKWHTSQQVKAANQAKMREGTELFMQLPNGYNVWRLMTTTALDNESDVMGHCVGRGGYDQGVQDGTTQIYSLRDASDTPHITFEVKKGQILQCKGTANTRPIKKYAPYIFEFVKQTGFEPAHDLANMYLVKDKAGKIWSIYDLPENLEVEKLDLRNADGVKIPAGLKCTILGLGDAKNITLPENLDAELLDSSDADGVKIPAGLKCTFLILSGAKNITLPENLEVKILGLSHTDGVKIPAGLKCKILGLTGAKNITLPENLEVEKLDLSYTDDVKIPAGLKRKILDLTGAKNITLPENLDAEMLDLSHTDGVKIPAGLKCKILDLTSAKNITLPENLEVEILNLDYTDGIIIPAGVRYKCLRCDGATNLKNNVPSLQGEFKKAVTEIKNDTLHFQWNSHNNRFLKE